MAHMIALVDSDRLVLAQNEASPIIVDTPAWFAWLEHATTFTFSSLAGRFTARKERQARGDGYWKAYRTSHGTLHRVSLGKAQDLTLARLNRAATTLTAASAPATLSFTAAVVSFTVLATKLVVPPVRSNLVLRPRLLERLQQSLHGKLTLISAPAGFGKSTLLSAWVATCGRPVAWLSLDAGDSDPIRFLTYLVAALQTVVPALGAGVMTLLHGPQSPPAESILTALLNEISMLPEPGVLILDDYHAIDAPPVDTALTFLLEHLPPQLHLVIVTREDPSLPLARMRARGDLSELRAADLRFTLTEATEFLNTTMGLRLAPDDIAALEARTEGWIAGLQLAALSLQGQPDASSFIQSFTGTHHFVLDYLVEEVLHRQSASVQMFLLRTSILDRLCGSLCDAVLCDLTASGQAILEYLERANLFIVPLDNERRWYRYHHLFADLLRQRLQQSPSVSPADAESGVEELHQRASQWYEDHDLELEAFQHAVAAHDVERAEHLLGGAAIPRHFRGAATTILDWLASLPTTVLNARPSLWWRHAWLLLTTGQPTGVEEKLQAAEAALHSTEKDDTTRNLIGQIAAARAVLALTRYDAETMHTQASRALEYLHPNNLAIRTSATWALGVAHQLQGNRAAACQALTDAISIGQVAGDLFTTILATLSLGDVQVAENQLGVAAETYQRVLQLLGDPPLPVASEAHLGLARICYEWNDLAAAERHGRQSLQLARQYGRNLDRFVICELFLAQLKLAQGDLAGTAALLAETSQSARERHFLHRLPELAALQVLTLLRQGHLADATLLVESHDLPISQARIHLAQGDTSAALELLETVRRKMEAKGWEDERLKLMVLEAVAHHAHGDTDRAVHVLGDALALAEPGGFVRLFLDEGPRMAALLAQSVEYRAQNPAIRLYAARLLSVFPEVQSAEHRVQNNLTPTLHHALERSSAVIKLLSERELEVLQWFAEGLSNQEIATRLFLSLHTIKVHSRNIYGKLGVHNRMQAVAMARALGMLPAV